MMASSFSPLIFPAEEWHSKETVINQLIHFHKKLAKTPNLEEAKKQNNAHIDDLKSFLKKEGLCKYVDYTGSAYEGVKTTEGELEFDIMFVADGNDLEFTPLPTEDGYVYIHNKTGLSSLSKFADKNNNQLLPKRFLEKFYSVVDKFIDKHKYRGIMKLRNHGPAVQMDVMHKDGRLWYSVDMVPAVETRCSHDVLRYVAKPLDDDEATWRQSFSKEEKKFLQNLDKNNSCHRQVLRILKTLCKRDSTLMTLNSYLLKTVLFHSVQHLELSWRSSDVEKRVFSMLGIIENYITKKRLPHFYLPTVNLIHDFEPQQVRCICNRLKNLRTKEKKFMKAFEVDKEKT
ncbi:cyclic GMP-AMP synthase-like [Hydractinia symbiolongicarpus]|uniref:cyclic GMP-AMP synthase-like n=1 Tax=Hydractinia symbiolongicarpus TaxID=13093 RepID=UPI00254DB687|nr:cyclic GMP-AMP synthase-like [Hydractinia symbiolongicarpus]XP_057302144.1 cyclic GMP-AMP synthase-like [Hydractinia symbiolongicarpus]